MSITHTSDHILSTIWGPFALCQCVSYFKLLPKHGEPCLRRSIFSTEEWDILDHEVKVKIDLQR